MLYVYFIALRKKNIFQENQYILVYLISLFCIIMLVFLNLPKISKIIIIFYTYYVKCILYLIIV